MSEEQGLMRLAVFYYNMAYTARWYGNKKEDKRLSALGADSAVRAGTLRFMRGLKK